MKEWKKKENTNLQFNNPYTHDAQQHGRRPCNGRRENKMAEPEGWRTNEILMSILDIVCIMYLLLYMLFGTTLAPLAALCHHSTPAIEDRPGLIQWPRQGKKKSSFCFNPSYLNQYYDKNNFDNKMTLPISSSLY